MTERQAHELAAKDFFVDCSQSIGRQPWSVNGRALCTGSAIFSFERERLLCKAEHFRLLGWGRVDVGKLR
eukprot:5041561-Lingulodinium_polyedra.AAC.1